MKNLFVTDLDGTFVKNSVSVAEDDLKAYHIAKNMVISQLQQEDL